MPLVWENAIVGSRFLCVQFACFVALVDIMVLRQFKSASVFVGLYMMIWTVCALVGGCIFGLGAYFANQGLGFWKYCGLNILPAVFLAEGIVKVIHIAEYAHIVLSIVLTIAIGIVLYLVINQQSAFSKRNILSLLLITALGMVGYEILFWITV